MTELAVINGDTKAFVILLTNCKYMTSNYFVISMSETKRVTAKGIPTLFRLSYNNTKSTE